MINLKGRQQGSFRRGSKQTQARETSHKQTKRYDSTQSASMGGIKRDSRIDTSEPLGHHRGVNQRFFDKEGAVEEIVLEVLLKNAKRRLREARENITKYQDYEKECQEEVRFLKSLIGEKHQDKDDSELTSEE